MWERQKDRWTYINRDRGTEREREIETKKENEYERKRQRDIDRDRQCSRLFTDEIAWRVKREIERDLKDVIKREKDKYRNIQM